MIVVVLGGAVEVAVSVMVVDWIEVTVVVTGCVTVVVAVCVIVVGIVVVTVSVEVTIVVAVAVVVEFDAPPVMNSKASAYSVMAPYENSCSCVGLALNVLSPVAFAAKMSCPLFASNSSIHNQAEDREKLDV